MKNVVILLFALVLITSCGGQKKQEEKEVRNVQLKGEEMPVDTACSDMHTELGYKEIKP